MNLAETIEAVQLTAGGPGSGRHPYATSHILDVLSHHGFEKVGTNKSGHSIYENDSGDVVLHDAKSGMWLHREKHSQEKKIGMGIAHLDKHLSRNYGNESYADYQNNTLSVRRKSYAYSSAAQKFWIGVDFDGTLVKQEKFPKIGPPVAKTVSRVKKWLKQGKTFHDPKGKAFVVKTVKIFTARADDPKQIPIIEAWCEKHLGQRLEVTNVKDSGCVMLVDNISERVKKNKGDVIAQAKELLAGGPGSGRRKELGKALGARHDALKDSMLAWVAPKQSYADTRSELESLHGDASAYAKKYGDDYSRQQLRLAKGSLDEAKKHASRSNWDRATIANSTALQYIHGALRNMQIETQASAFNPKLPDQEQQTRLVNDNGNVHAENKTDGRLPSKNDPTRHFNNDSMLGSFKCPSCGKKQDFTAGSKCNRCGKKMKAGGPGSGRHKGIASDVPEGRASECQTNSSRVFKKKGYAVVIGYAHPRARSENASTGKGFYHAWNITPDGKLYDSTLGSKEAARTVYHPVQILDSKTSKSPVKIDRAFYKMKATQNEEENFSDELESLLEDDQRIAELVDLDQIDEALHRKTKRDLHGGGPGSGWFEDKGHIRHPKANSGKTVNKKGWTVNQRKSEDAKKSVVRIAQAEQAYAEDILQEKVAQALGGKVYGKDSEAVDVVVKDAKGRLHGIEVKGVIAKKSDNNRAATGRMQQITMTHGAIPRKLAWRDNWYKNPTYKAKINDLLGKTASRPAFLHTVIVDTRNGMDVYHAPKVGSLSFDKVKPQAAAKPVQSGLKGLRKTVLGS